MKKFLLLALVAMIGMPVLAQDEIGDDVTKYVINAGFDEDLTFQADGTMKTAVSTNTSLSDRSWAYIAADSTVYARPKTTSGQNRPDGRKLEAVNGFKGRVKGWTLESNADFPKCEWTYFGTVPYDLANQSVPIADDGSTYLEVPERPTEFDGGEGFVYLRAGWTNSAIYKQVVKLPCARYRLEYWTININPNTSAVAEDLTKIVCRNEVFKDEEGTGLNAQEWTKHEFEFTPTAEFTMQFGYQAANAGSGGQPIVALDGIKLIKIEDAIESELLASDCWAYLQEFEELSGEFGDYAGIVAEMADLYDELEVATGSDDLETLRKTLEDIKAALAKYTALKDDVAALEQLVTECEQLSWETDYPGKADFEAAITAAQDKLDNGGSEDIVKALAELKKAMFAYYASQEASFESPADYTFAVQNPWFVAKSGEPTQYADGTYYFPGIEDAENPYNVGSAPFDGTSEGWYICGTFTGGDQRLNFQQGRTCWNAWGSSITGTIGIAQDIVDLPNGFYKVQADLITQYGYCTDQHTFAKSALGEKASAALTHDTWIDGGDGEWETLATEDAVIVTDGKLTIGAIGTGTGEASAGWFLVTNFKLFYCGPATDEQVAEALAAHEAEVKEQIAAMHFAADKAAANALIDEYAKDKSLETLNKAAELAETSEAKYDEIMQEGKTIPTVEANLEDGTYGTAAAIARFALDYVKAYLASDEATYEKVDSVLDEVKNYTNTYIPVYMEADEMMQSSRSKLVTQVLEQRLVAHRTLLISEMKDAETIEAYVEELRSLMYEANKQEIYETSSDGDYTGFIRNPMAEGKEGWTFECTDGPIKSGQWYTGDGSVNYFDSWNATEGALTFYGEQVIVGLPNGTYTIGADVRTSGEGAYVFGAGTEAKTDLKWVEIPLQTYTHPDDETGEDVTELATDKWGQIWEDACARYESMTDADPDYFYLMNIVNANGGNGRGWEHLDIENVVVKDHVLVLGMAVNAGGAPKAFTGTWFSTNNWTLTLINEGDNTDWEGPLADGISEVTVSTKAADGIYTVNGMRAAKLQKGLNIVVRDGKAMKVLVK